MGGVLELEELSDLAEPDLVEGRDRVRDVRLQVLRELLALRNHLLFAALHGAVVVADLPERSLTQDLSKVAAGFSQSEDGVLELLLGQPDLAESRRDLVLDDVEGLGLV